MVRPIDKTRLPPHPAISNRYKMVQRYGEQRLCAKLTCPQCKESKWFPLWTLRQYFKRGERFTGHCRSCASYRTRAGHKLWLTKNSMGRHITSGGYVELAACLVSEIDLPMFLAMCSPSYRRCVAEHRWLMAKHLGRPLLSSESIDHMDGVKTNNAIDNLRIYLRGKNQEGSGNGYGTYYHEWQMALAKISALESAL